MSNIIVVVIAPLVALRASVSHILTYLLPLAPPPTPLTAEITSVFCTCLLIGQIIALNALCRHLARDPLTTHSVGVLPACALIALLCSI